MKQEVYCPYKRDWLPLGRSRKKCPRCGAVLGTNTHPTRDAES
jgi:ribosomal protein S27AE